MLEERRSLGQDDHEVLGVLALLLLAVYAHLGQLGRGARRPLLGDVPQLRVAVRMNGPPRDLLGVGRPAVAQGSPSAPVRRRTGPMARRGQASAQLPQAGPHPPAVAQRSAGGCGSLSAASVIRMAGSPSSPA